MIAYKLKVCPINGNVFHTLGTIKSNPDTIHAIVEQVLEADIDADEVRAVPIPAGNGFDTVAAYA